MSGRAWIDNLPAELAGQQAIMRGLLGVCEADDRVRWLAIGCSLGRAAADPLSDLDMALGVRDELFDATVADIRAAVDGLADLVDSYHHLLPEVAGPHERVFAQYADRCQLDLMVFPASRQIGKVPNAVVLYDADDQIVLDTERPEVTPEQLREWAFHGWCRLADLGKYVRRRSLWEALECLHQARGHLWRLWAVALGVREPQYGITSILDYAPDKVPDSVEATVADLDPDRLLRAAVELARQLTEVGTMLPAEHQAALPAAMARFITSDLAALTAAAHS